MTDTTKAQKLKPCPFCGEPPYTRTRQDEDLSTHDIVDWHFVGCSNCDVSFGIPDGYDCGTAVEQWNTRADHSDALIAAAREEALREALQRIADLKRGHSEDVDEGHEQAYRAIEALITKDQANG